MRAAMDAAGVKPVWLGHNRHARVSVLDDVPEVAGYYAFTFVRHPARWLESLWAFRMEQHEGSGDADDIDIPMYQTFPEFLSNYLAHRGGYVSEYFSSYTAGVDYVGTTTSLSDHLEAALLAAGEPFDTEALRAVPPLNVSKRRPICSPEQVDDVEAAEVSAMTKWQL